MFNRQTTSIMRRFAPAVLILLLGGCAEEEPEYTRPSAECADIPCPGSGYPLRVCYHETSLLYHFPDGTSSADEMEMLTYCETGLTPAEIEEDEQTDGTECSCTCSDSGD
jgi:hypothetical protein